MTETMNEEQPKLTTGDNILNHASATGMIIVWLAAAQWLVTSWLAQYRYAKRRGRTFKLRWPHTIEVFVMGGRAQMVIENLRSFGISAQGLDSQMTITGNCKGILMSFWVAESQWEMVDAILVQLAEGSYIVTSVPGSKRGAVFTKRWGVGAKARSFDEGINGAIGNMFKHELKTPKTAKLGGRYK